MLCCWWCLFLNMINWMLIVIGQLANSSDSCHYHDQSLAKVGHQTSLLFLSHVLFCLLIYSTGSERTCSKTDKFSRSRLGLERGARDYGSRLTSFVVYIAADFYQQLVSNSNRCFKRYSTVGLMKTKMLLVQSICWECVIETQGWMHRPYTTATLLSRGLKSEKLWALSRCGRVRNGKTVYR